METKGPVCESCEFFVPHYVRDNRKFTLCGIGRCKQRRLNAPCCPQYQSRA